MEAYITKTESMVVEESYIRKTESLSVDEAYIRKTELRKPTLGRRN